MLLDNGFRHIYPKKKKKKTQNYNEFVNINSMKIINMYILFFKICALQLIISIY